MEIKYLNREILDLFYGKFQEKSFKEKPKKYFDKKSIVKFDTKAID